MIDPLSHDALKDDLPIATDAKVVGPVRLIFETEKMVFVRRGYSQTTFGRIFLREQAGQVVGIDKSRVTTLIYHRRPAFFELD